MESYDNFAEIIKSGKLNDLKNNQQLDIDYQQMVNNIMSIYQQFNINENTSFGDLKKSVPSKQWNTLMSQINTLREDLDDEAYNLFIRKRNGSQYDLLANTLALGFLSMYVHMAKNIDANVKRESVNELSRLNDYYTKHGLIKHPIKMKFKYTPDYKPRLLTHFIWEVNNSRHWFRQDIMAGRSINKSIGRMFKRLGVLKGRTKVAQQWKTEDMAIDTQKDFATASGYESYRVVAEPSACYICLPMSHDTYKFKDFEKGVNAPLFHINCRCSITPILTYE